MMEIARNNFFTNINSIFSIIAFQANKRYKLKTVMTANIYIIYKIYSRNSTNLGFFTNHRRLANTDRRRDRNVRGTNGRGKNQ